MATAPLDTSSTSRASTTNVSNRRKSSASVVAVKETLFRPLRWLSTSTSALKNRSPSFVHPLDRNDGGSSWDFSNSDREHNKKELEELTAATWKQNSRIALLGLSEIQLAAGSSCEEICNVERIVLRDEYTAEYLQQEKHRMQLLQTSKTKLLSLKRIPPGSTRAKKRHLKYLIHEAGILAKLGEHPNIPSLRALPATSCPFHDFFILTDRLHPDTLETRIRSWQQGNNNWMMSDDDTTATPDEDRIPRKTNYALQIAQALQTCHEAGIVVRDLCPDTIGFSTHDPHCIQLLELGHAMDTKTLSVPMKMVGNQRYLAAEVWKTGQYTRATDVYSWAMIFYELIMERKPFHSLSAEEHQNFVWEKGDRPLVASYSLPDGMKPLMEQAWANDPSDRLTIDQVVHQTKAVLMNLEHCMFWTWEEDDFLFDVYLEKDTDTISEIGEITEFEPILAAEVVLDADVTFSQDSMSGASLKSRASSTFSVNAKQHKIVSSAA